MGNLSNINDTLNVEQKLAKVMLALREIRPFYSCIYEVMDKIERPEFGTVGVTTNSFVYDSEFIDKTPFDEFIFIMLHEVAHIALQHVARRENRDGNLWNIACDLYVNAVLSKEFSLGKPGTTGTLKRYNIKFPEGGLFCSTLDIDTDYTESIYSELEEQAKSNGYNDATLSEALDGKAYEFSYTGSEGKEGSSGRAPMEDGYRTFSIQLNPNKVKNDLIDTGADQNIKNQESNKIVSDATVRVEMSGTNVGDDSGGLQVLAKKLLKSELDWKKLLRRYLIAATSKDSSFSNPDKRMYYQKSIYPGQTCDEASEIKGVKVCIDTSGSVSDKDIEYFCGQVYALTKQYNIEAELIYWDSSVESTGKFKGYKEFERVACYGRGGTRPEVVFEYFESKKCKIKPIITLMFTDGFFYDDWANAKMKKKYKDCIWVLTREHNKNYIPPFGKKALVKFK